MAFVLFCFSQLQSKLSTTTEAEGGAKWQHDPFLRRRILICFTFHSLAGKGIISSLFLENFGAAGPVLSSVKTFYCYLTVGIRVTFLQSGSEQRKDSLPAPENGTDNLINPT